MQVTVRRIVVSCGNLEKKLMLKTHMSVLALPI